MSAHSQSLILHQYEMSPFSEKIRVIFGMKGLEWHACDQPRIMPKPDLVALTGGYRRIPVLQIGGDLYFDTVLIIDELERRFPTPSVYGGAGRGMAQALEGWADQGLFWQVVTALFGGDIPADAAFMADRSALLGRPFDQAAMKAASPEALRLMAGYFDLAEQQLADGRAYLFGAQPGAVDASLYHNVAFLRWGRGRAAKVLDAFPHLLAWEARVKAIGHGRRGADVSGQDAILIARNAEPAALPQGTMIDGSQLKDNVQILYNDANTQPLVARVVSINRRNVIARYEAAATAGIFLHMPLSSLRDPLTLVSSYERPQP